MHRYIYSDVCVCLTVCISTYLFNDLSMYVDLSTNYVSIYLSIYRYTWSGK